MGIALSVSDVRHGRDMLSGLTEGLPEYTRETGVSVDRGVEEIIVRGQSSRLCKEGVFGYLIYAVAMTTARMIEGNLRSLISSRMNCDCSSGHRGCPSVLMRCNDVKQGRQLSARALPSLPKPDSPLFVEGR